MKSNEQKKSKKKVLWFLLLLFIFLFFVFNLLGFPLKTFLISFFDRGNLATSLPPGGNSAKIDPNLVGSWDTGCLIPKGNSDYAERHSFIFNSNGTANYKRYIGGRACNNLSLRNNHEMTWEIVGGNKINFVYGTGGRIYDIYALSGNILKFGHGFCDCTDIGGKSGASDSDRFVLLNNFLVYKKQ